jgi:general secretion pathway protein D
MDVGIKLALEVSSIVKEIPGPNGSLAYQIGTRNAQTVLRLRDGETQIIGGLISAEDRNASARLPGLGHLPMVGKLFGNNSLNNKKSEIVLSITPRIVRPPAGIDPTLRTVFSGTESSVRERPVLLDPIGAAQGQSSGGAPTPSGSPSARPPAPGPGSVGGGATSAAPATPTPTPTQPVPSTAARELLQRMNNYRPAGAPSGTPALASPPPAAPTSAPSASPAAAKADTPGEEKVQQ